MQAACTGGNEANRQDAGIAAAAGAGEPAAADDRPTALQAADDCAAAAEAMEIVLESVGESLAAESRGDEGLPGGSEGPREPASGGEAAPGSSSYFPSSTASACAAPGTGLHVRLQPERVSTDGISSKKPDPWLLFNDVAVSASSAAEARALYDGRMTPCLLYYTQVCTRLCPRSAPLFTQCQLSSSTACLSSRAGWVKSVCFVCCSVLPPRILRLTGIC